MGGYGSGWHGGTNGRPDARQSVGDARRFTLRGMRPFINAAEQRRADGHLGRAVSGTTTWKNGDESTASVGFSLDVNAAGLALSLDYSFKAESRFGGASLVVRIPLDTTAGNSGGVRYWMRCPGLPGVEPCGRRCAAVYLSPGARRFACRRCHGLTYESCRESHRFDSLFRRLAAQMGTDAGTVKRALSRSW